MTSEDVSKYLADIWNTQVKVDKDRQIMFACGRGGAMMQHFHLLKSIEEEVLGRKLVQDEEDKIQEKVDAMIWEDGIYETDSKTGMLQYKGLWDKEHSDGTFITTIHGNYYIEWWKNGFRTGFKIITKEEWESLKESSNK